MQFLHLRACDSLALLKIGAAATPGATGSVAQRLLMVAMPCHAPSSVSSCPPAL